MYNTCTLKEDIHYTDSEGNKKIIKSGLTLTIIKYYDELATLRYGNRLFLVDKSKIEIN